MITYILTKCKKIVGANAPTVKYQFCLACFNFFWNTLCELVFFFLADIIDKCHWKECDKWACCKNDEIKVLYFIAEVCCLNSIFAFNKADCNKAQRNNCLTDTLSKLTEEWIKSIKWAFFTLTCFSVANFDAVCNDSPNRNNSSLRIILLYLHNKTLRNYCGVFLSTSSQFFRQSNCFLSFFSYIEGIYIISK